MTRRWSARAHMCWASSVFLFVVFLTYALEWTFDSHLGFASTAGGVLLWLLEVFAAVLCCAYLWEICDALRSLLRLDYPRYEIILIDDNTDDEALWRPVEAWCARHAVKFAHLDNWPGYSRER